MAQAKHQKCQVCLCDTIHQVVYDKWGYPILKCESCGLGTVGINGSFDPSAIYNEGYFQGQQADGYYDYQGSEAVLRAEFRRTLDSVARYGTEMGKLLEIGCAYGFFLTEASKRFECVGIEIAKEAVAFCRSRGLDVTSEDAHSRAIVEKGPYDCIVMLDVIEHLEEPDSIIAAANMLLREAGLIVITTGDWDSLLSKVMGAAWRLMTPPQHLFYFSRRTLTALLVQNGFEVVECVYPWKKVPLGLAAYQLRRWLGIEIPLTQSMSNLGIPVNLFDSMRVIARKKRLERVA